MIAQQKTTIIDERIKIINNTENRVLLYSRALGVINSKGEYIFDRPR